jgi:hypothetical protein
MSKHTQNGKRDGLKQNKHDYWMLAIETKDHLYYLSKSKKFIKKRKIGINKYGELICRPVQLTRKDRKVFNREELWQQKFGDYRKEYK